MFICLSVWQKRDILIPTNLNWVFFMSTVSNTVTVTLQPNWSQIFSGETITVRCEIQGGGNTGWTYEWETPSSNNPPSRNEYRINRATVSDSGDYRCRGGSVTLTCSVDRSAGWTVFKWYRRSSDSSEAQVINGGRSNHIIRISEGGIYTCRGGRGKPEFFTEESNKVTIQKTGEFSHLFCNKTTHTLSTLPVYQYGRKET
uniref:Ig-like domain-containing protein n=1 Tax=Lates calcarifer TaxID=8187 RepID=A0A4W6D741_LATCA